MVSGVGVLVIFVAIVTYIVGDYISGRNTLFSLVLTAGVMAVIGGLLLRFPSHAHRLNNWLEN